MAVNRWVVHLLLLLGLPTLPACFISTRPRATDTNAEPATKTAWVSGHPVETSFAVLPRVPGERVPLQETTPPGHSETMPVAADGGSEQITRPAVPDDVAPPAGPPGPLPPITIPTPTPPEPPLLAAVRAYLDNHPERAVEHLNALDKANQDLVLQLVPALVQASRMNMRQASPLELGVLQGQLERPVAALSARAPLAVEKACFCRAVSNFGRYDPWPDGHAFRPGSLAGLYVEVRNVPSVPASTPTDGPGFVTELVCTLQIRDRAGTPVPLVVVDPNNKKKLVPMLYTTKRDFTRSAVRDYYVAFWFPAPPQPGAYTVSFEVRDPAGQRAVERIMPFKVQ
jgi:hypothetical protein